LKNSLATSYPPAESEEGCPALFVRASSLRSIPSSAALLRLRKETSVLATPKPRPKFAGLARLALNALLHGGKRQLVKSSDASRCCTFVDICGAFTDPVCMISPSHTMTETSTAWSPWRPRCPSPTTSVMQILNITSGPLIYGFSFSFFNTEMISRIHLAKRAFRRL
jgi:hypothetical protein